MILLAGEFHSDILAESRTAYLTRTGVARFHSADSNTWEVLGVAPGVYTVVAHHEIDFMKTPPVLADAGFVSEVVKVGAKTPDPIELRLP